MTDRGKNKGRAETKSFAGIPRAVMEHANYFRLSHTAKALLLELCYQYRGRNNGDLCAAFKLMTKRGWKCRSSVDRALAELVHYGMIVKTRQGGRNAPNLYALAWEAIDDCKGKLDVRSTTRPPGDWKREKPDYKMPKRQRKISFPCPENRQPLPGKQATKSGFGVDALNN